MLLQYSFKLERPTKYNQCHLKFKKNIFAWKKCILFSTSKTCEIKEGKEAVTSFHSSPHNVIVFHFFHSRLNQISIALSENNKKEKYKIVRDRIEIVSCCFKLSLCICPTDIVNDDDDDFAFIISTLQQR